MHEKPAYFFYFFILQKFLIKNCLVSWLFFASFRTIYYFSVLSVDWNLLSKNNLKNKQTLKRVIWSYMVVPLSNLIKSHTYIYRYQKVNQVECKSVCIRSIQHDIIQERIQDFKLGGGAHFFLGYFVWKITILCKKKFFFSNIRGHIQKLMVLSS